MGSLDRANLGEYLSAYLDDELNAEERTAVEKWIAGDAEARAQYDDLRRTVDMVRSLPLRAAPAGMADDLTAMAERRQLLDEGAAWSPKPHMPWWRSASTWLSAAAVLMIAVGGGFFVRSQMGHPDGAASGLSDNTLAMATPQDSIESNAADRLLKAETTVPAAPIARNDVSNRGNVADRTANATEDLGQDKDRALLRGGARPTPVAAPPTDARERFRPEESAVVAMNRSGRGGADSYRQLLLEKKLAGDQPAEALVEHDVSVEQNHLYVAVRDEGDIELAQRQLDQFAASNAYQNVEPTNPAPTIRGGDPLVMRQGRATNSMGEEVVALARIPARQLMALQASLEKGTSSRRSMQMRIGPVRAYSNAEVAETIQSMQSPRYRGGLRQQPMPESVIAQTSGGRAPASSAAMDDRFKAEAVDAMDKSASATIADAADAEADRNANLAAPMDDALAMGAKEQGQSLGVEALPAERGRDVRNRKVARARRAAGANEAPSKTMQPESGELRVSKDSPSMVGGDLRSNADEFAEAEGVVRSEQDQPESADQPAASEPTQDTSLLRGVGRAFAQMQQWFAPADTGGFDTNAAALGERYEFRDATAVGPGDDQDELVTLVIHFQLPTMKAKKVAPATGPNGNAVGAPSEEASDKASDG